MTAYARPASLSEALDVRARHPGWTVLAGGTDLMVDPAAFRDLPTAEGGQLPESDGGHGGVLDVFALDELHGVTSERDGVVRIGACTTYAELLASDVVGRELPLLLAAASEVGAVQIRERGTVGGNVMTASPVGDLLPCLLALDARVVLASLAGTRAVEYEAFLTGYRTVDVAPTELLVAIDVPVPPSGTVQHWRKVGTRAAQSISKLSLAAVARLADAHVRVALGGVADRPVRLHDVEQLVAAGAPVEEVRGAVRASIDPLTDVRSTAEYRRDVAANLVARFVRSLV